MNWRDFPGRRRPSGSWAGTSGRYLLAVAVCGAALAAGTVHLAVLCAVAALVVVSAVLVWSEEEPERFRPRRAATLLLGIGVVLTAYTALQCLPIPISVLAFVAPHNAAVWSRALDAAQEPGPRWAPISLDPTATMIEVLKGVTYLVAFVAALRIARHRDGTAFLAIVVGGTGVILCVASLLHPAFGAHKLYGVWEPSGAVLAHAKHVGPFLNPNNLAAYINLALCLVIATAIGPERGIPRIILYALALFLAGTQLWVASRGGVGAMLVGIVLVLLLSRVLSRQRHRSEAVGSLVVGLSIVAGLGMVVLGGSDEATSELFEHNITKLRMVLEVARMLPAYGLFGTGRGAFESTFPEFRVAVGNLVYAYPENVVAQWVVEWGVPVGLAGLVAIAATLRPSEALVRSGMAVGAWCGVAAVVLQNLLDLGSEVPGLVLGGVLCTAIVVGGSSGRSSGGWMGWGARSGTVRLACAAGIAAVACGIALAPRQLEADREHLYEALTAGTDATEFERLAKAAILRHPAEPYLPLLEGVRLAHEGRPESVRWLDATLERAAVYGPAHFVLARLFAAPSPAQGRLEYRLAMEQAPDALNAVMGEAPRLVSGFEDAMELIPHDLHRAYVLEQLAEALQTRLPATCARLDREALSGSEPARGALLRLAGNAVGDIDPDNTAPWCEGEAWDDCMKKAKELSGRAAQTMPESCEAHVLQANTRLASGDPSGALDELSASSDSLVDRVPCLKALVVLARKAHDDRRGTEALSKIATAGCSRDAECAGNLLWAAAMQQQAGNLRQALALMDRAATRMPESDAPVVQAAQLAASLGLHAEAADRYAKLARRHPNDAQWPLAVQRERLAAMHSALSL